MMNDDDENNKPSRKIQIFNNKDGTYNRKEFVDNELVNEETGTMKKEFETGPNLEPVEGSDSSLPLDHPTNKKAFGVFEQLKREEKPGDTLRSFLSNLNNDPLPRGWRDTPIGKRAYNCGFESGYDAAAEQYERTLDAIRRILELEAQREF